MRSFDVFDTLIGRKCYLPKNIFWEMAHKLGDVNFPAKRIAAERYFQNTMSEYSLDDIYMRLGKPELASMEFQLELDNVFPITRYARRLRDDDILVSDMYLNANQIRELLMKAGINFQGEIVVSNYGKITGNVWKQVKPILHTGNNVQTDVIGPKAYNIPTQEAFTQFTGFEKRISEHSRELAYWIRYHRLKSIINEQSDHELLNFIFLEYNIPLLYCMTQLILEHAKQKGFKKLLFMSRDTNLLMKMFLELHRLRIDAEYIYISREALVNGSKTYFKYLYSKLDKKATLIDMASSCGSLVKALPKIPPKTINLFTGIFLESFGVDVTGINLSCITTNKKTYINNTLVEMLNYASDHNQILDMHELGNTWVPIFADYKEYDVKRVREYHDLFQQMMEDIPIVKIEKPIELYTRCLAMIQGQSRYLLKTFPNHIPIEKMRKKRL